MIKEIFSQRSSADLGMVGIKILFLSELKTVSLDGLEVFEKLGFPSSRKGKTLGARSLVYPTQVMFNGYKKNL